MPATVMATIVTKISGKSKGPLLKPFVMDPCKGAARHPLHDQT